VSFQKFYNKSFGMLFIILTGVTAMNFAQTSRPTPIVIINQNQRELPVAGSNNTGFGDSFDGDWAYRMFFVCARWFDFRNRFTGQSK